MSEPGDTIAKTLKLGRPAHRALAAAGIVTFADLAKWTRRDIAALHGIGPKSLVALDPAMAERDLSYKT